MSEFSSENGSIENVLGPYQQDVEMEYDKEEFINFILENYKFKRNNSKEIFIQYLQGYKYEEIANNIGIPLGTVKNNIHTIFKKDLKILIKKYKLINPLITC